MATEVKAKQPGVSGDIALEKIKIREKFSYGLLVMASNPLLGLATGYLMLFYTNIVGLNAIAVGTLFLIARIMDGVSDPIMGYLIDHMPRNKMGKFRFTMIVGAFLCVINYMLMWFGPVWAPAGKLAVAYFTYLIFGFTFDLMDIPKNSLLPAMTANNKERTSLGKYQGIFTLISSTLTGFLAPVILASGKSSMKAFTTVVLIISLGALVVAVVGALGVKERVLSANEGEKHSVKEYVQILIQKPVLATLLFSVVFSMAMYIGSAVNAYYFTYIIKDLAKAGTVALLQLAGLIPGIMVAGFVMRKLGKRGTFIAAPLVMILGFAIRWINPLSVELIYASTLIIGFVLGVYMPVGQVITADNIDYAEYKLNYRSEAAVASIGSFVAKVGNGISGAIPGFALGFAGFIAGSQTQPDSVIKALIWIAIGIPPVLLAISAVIFGVGYKLNAKTLEQVEETLSERRIAR